MVRFSTFINAVVLSVAICFLPITGTANDEPSAVELAMWEYAVSTGKVEEVDRFLDLYPGSIFTDAAKQLKASLAETANESATNEDSGTATPQPPADPVTFIQPLSTDPSDQSRSLQDLANGSPLFPPIAGLPAEIWEDKNCSNCHAWQKDNLCEQAQFLASRDADAKARIQHPYGGFFKDALKLWAAGGCL